VRRILASYKNVDIGGGVYALSAVGPRKQPAATNPRGAHVSGSHVRSDPVYVVKARLFRVLGHPVRIRILELLRNGERTVGDLQDALHMDSSGTSQHLAALREQGVLESRRVGTSVYYRIRDPRVSQLLAVAKQILTSALSESHVLLENLADESATRRSS
jgi:DNA-binding transcriptional ArsR family regulator